MPKSKSKKRAKKNMQVTIPSPVDANIRVVVASELADDDIIEREMTGEVLPFFVYRFKQEGGEVVGLTVKGVNEVVRRLNRNPKSGSKIRINPQYLVKEEVEREGEKGIEVSVYAEDLVSGNSAWGVKFEPYMATKRDGGRYKNKFATEKALSKAERNAKRKLISEMVAVKIIDKLIKEEPSTVKQIEAPAFETQVLTPRKPVATTPEDKMAIIRKAIATQRSQSAIIEIDQRTQASAEFSDDFKKEIHKSASARVDELGSK